MGDGLVKNPVREHGASSMEKASYLRGLIAKPAWPFIPARESGAFWLFHVKSPPPSLRGAKRRGNLFDIRAVMRLLRFARNDESALFGLFANAPTGKTSHIL
jgi:hypothetical protein